MNKGNYYYSEYKGIKIKSSQQYQIDYLIKLLKLVEKRNITLDKRKIKRVEVTRFTDNTVAYYIYKTKTIQLNSSNTRFPPKNKVTSRRYLEYSLSTLIHELVHAYDTKDIISNLFLEEYVKAVEKACYHMDAGVLTLPSRRKIQKIGLVEFLNNKDLSRKDFRHYFDVVDKKLKLPTVYALTNVYEFTAEILSLYLTRKTYITNKKYKRICEKAIRLLQ